MQLPSSLLENAVAQFAKLPGIGKKTALRLVLHLLKQDADDVTMFGDTIKKCAMKLSFVSAAIILVTVIFVRYALIVLVTNKSFV